MARYGRVSVLSVYHWAFETLQCWSQSINWQLKPQARLRTKATTPVMYFIGISSPCYSQPHSPFHFTTLHSTTIKLNFRGKKELQKYRAMYFLSLMMLKLMCLPQKPALCRGVQIHSGKLVGTPPAGWLCRCRQESINLHSCKHTAAKPPSKAHEDFLEYSTPLNRKREGLQQHFY